MCVKTLCIRVGLLAQTLFFWQPTSLFTQHHHARNNNVTISLTHSLHARLFISSFLKTQQASFTLTNYLTQPSAFSILAHHDANAFSYWDCATLTVRPSRMTLKNTDRGPECQTEGKQRRFSQGFEGVEMLYIYIFVYRGKKYSKINKEF